MSAQLYSIMPSGRSNDGAQLNTFTPSREVRTAKYAFTRTSFALIELRIRIPLFVAMKRNSILVIRYFEILRTRPSGRATVFSPNDNRLVIVWTAISVNRVNELVLIDGKLNSNSYMRALHIHLPPLKTSCNDGMLLSNNTMSHATHF